MFDLTVEKGVLAVGGTVAGTLKGTVDTLGNTVGTLGDGLGGIVQGLRDGLGSTVGAVGGMAASGAQNVGSIMGIGGERDGEGADIVDDAKTNRSNVGGRHEGQPRVGSRDHSGDWEQRR